MSSFRTRGGISIKHANSLILVLTILLARSVTVCLRAEPRFVFNSLRTQNNSNLKAHSLLLRETPLYEQRGDILLGKGSVIVKSTARNLYSEQAWSSEGLINFLLRAVSLYSPEEREEKGEDGIYLHSSNISPQYEEIGEHTRQPRDDPGQMNNAEDKEDATWMENGGPDPVRPSACLWPPDVT